jgi:hypothetical protein
MTHPTLTSGASGRVYQSVVLTAIAILLGVLAMRPAVYAPPAYAQTDFSHLHIEPGTTILRSVDGRGEVQGKVVVDLRSAGLEADLPGPL